MLYRMVLVVPVGVWEGMGGTSRCTGLRVRNEVHVHTAVLSVVVSDECGVTLARSVELTWM